MRDDKNLRWVLNSLSTGLFTCQQAMGEPIALASIALRFLPGKDVLVMPNSGLMKSEPILFWKIL